MQLLVVRHGEKLDEVDKSGWERTCRESDSRKFTHARIDAPLTAPGVSMAKEVADTVYKIQMDLNREGACQINAIYCSRMLRAAMTAYPIAKKMGLPLFVSTGLARSVKHVRTLADGSKESGGFQFTSFDRIVAHCRGVMVEDADKMGIPTDSWVRACGAAACRSRTDGGTALIVGHREMHRGLAGVAKLATPHCCVYTFDVAGDGEDKEDYTCVQGMKRDGSPL